MEININKMANDIIKESKVQFDISVVSGISALADILIEKGIITVEEFDNKYLQYKKKAELEQKRMIKKGIRDEIKNYKAGGNYEK